MYTKPLKNTGLNVKAGKNERSIRTRIEIEVNSWSFILLKWFGRGILWMFTSTPTEQR